ncbi:MAG: hypothetical protein WCY19_03270 [Candidatus Gastranaerophilaceae bacterium]
MGAFIPIALNLVSGLLGGGKDKAADKTKETGDTNSNPLNSIFGDSKTGQIFGSIFSALVKQ